MRAEVRRVGLVLGRLLARGGGEVFQNGFGEQICGGKIAFGAQDHCLAINLGHQMRFTVGTVPQLPGGSARDPLTGDEGVFSGLRNPCRVCRSGLREIGRASCRERVF